MKIFVALESRFRGNERRQEREQPGRLAAASAIVECAETLSHQRHGVKDYFPNYTLDKAGRCQAFCSNSISLAFDFAEENMSRIPRLPQSIQQYHDLSEERYDLCQWTWAFIHDAEELIAFSSRLRAMTKPPIRFSAEWTNERILLQKKLSLAGYHLAMVTGMMLRHLNALAPKYASVQLAFDKATHLNKEGERLRNMTEHAKANREADKRGNPRKGFMRKAPDAAFPGSEDGLSDPTGLVINNHGHWLGGRFNVELALSEVQAISEAADAIPIPLPGRPPTPHP
jgi:hypothetical protein